MIEILVSDTFLARVKCYLTNARFITRLYHQSGVRTAQSM